MTLPYQTFEEEYVQVANLTQKNISKFNVVSKYVRKVPAFILPDGTIMYMTTEHTSADFYEDIETCVTIIKKDIDKTNKKQHLEMLRQNIINDYYRFKKDSANILASDVRSYLDIEVQTPFSYNLGISNLFNREMQDILLSLTKSKISIYNYFIDLTIKSDDIINCLKEYPTTVRKTNFNQIMVDLENMKAELLKKFDTSIIEMFNNTFMEFSKDPIMHITDPFFMQDLVVLSLGIDKIETQASNTITTTRLNLNEFYFNYLIMGYNIVKIPAISFDEKLQKFIKVEEKEYSIATFEDRKYAEEIELIKKKVPYKERPKYFI